MAAQDVADLVPRVRRAIEGPRPITGPDALTDDMVEALAADAIADLILLTYGDWGHTLVVSETDADPPNYPIHWQVDPGLAIHEETVVASQAALTQVFHTVKSMKVSETIRNEGQEWSWQTSASALREHIKFLIDQRNMALDALKAGNPVLARVASILAVRDQVGHALIEPWLSSGVGGQALLAP